MTELILKSPLEVEELCAAVHAVNDSSTPIRRKYDDRLSIWSIMDYVVESNEDGTLPSDFRVRMQWAMNSLVSQLPSKDFPEVLSLSLDDDQVSFLHRALEEHASVLEDYVGCAGGSGSDEEDDHILALADAGHNMKDRLPPERFV